MNGQTERFEARKQRFVCPRCSEEATYAVVDHQPHGVKGEDEARDRTVCFSCAIELRWVQ
jgi:predicted RNA-binding Zn-ribbon protein involved in translation (DUF1610 family)